MLDRANFIKASEKVGFDFSIWIPIIISYKSFIQKEILKIVSKNELEDLRNCRINQGLIDKLCLIAKHKWELSGDMESLYCVSIAVGTIIKEYDWGIKYLSPKGLFELAVRILNS